jgi:hypothetical protein
MAGFLFRLELEGETSADPPTFETAVPNWTNGDTIPLGRDRILRVIETRPGGNRAKTRCYSSRPPRTEPESLEAKDA